MQFITLADAAALTGKTLITIRRLAKKPFSKPYTKIESGKLFIDKGYCLSKYPAVTTQSEYAEDQPEYAETAQVHTQNEYAESTQPDQDKAEQHTQIDHMDTQLLIQALKEQYENRIQDLKEALQSKEREIERISTLFDQQQKLEMARATLLPAKTNNYTESETVEPEPAPVPVEKKRRWWHW